MKEIAQFENFRSVAKDNITTRGTCISRDYLPLGWTWLNLKQWKPLFLVLIHLKLYAR